jgi:hypothetical protein
MGEKLKDILFLLWMWQTLIVAQIENVSGNAFRIEINVNDLYIQSWLMVHGSHMFCLNYYILHAKLLQMFRPLRHLYWEIFFNI